MEESNLKISQVFRQQWRLILIVTLLFTCLCAVLIYQYKPIYRAKVMLAPLTELDSSFQNVTLMNYFEISKEKNFNLTEMYALFVSYLVSPTIRRMFYTQIYWPSFEHSQLDKKGYDNFSKVYDIQLYLENKEQKYLVSAAGMNSKKAIEKLNKYIAFVNQKAFEALVLYTANRRKIVDDELLFPIVPRKAEFYQNDISSLNFKIFSMLSRLYEANYLSFKPPLIKSSVVALFRYDPEVTLSSTELGPRLTRVLYLGIFGGLILGFLIGAFRIGLQRTSKAPN